VVQQVKLTGAGAGVAMRPRCDRDATFNKQVTEFVFMARLALPYWLGVAKFGFAHGFWSKT
jgi:hypothetical protein